MPGAGFEKIDICSRELEKVTEYITSSYAAVKLEPILRQQQYGVLGKAITYEGIFLERSVTVGGFRVTPCEPFDVTLFNFMHSLSVGYSFGSNQVEVGAGQVIGYQNADHVDVLDASSHTTITLSNNALNRRLSELLDAPLAHQLRFNETPIEQARLVPLTKLVALMEQDNFSEVASFISMKSGSLKNLVLDSFLFGFPNNYSERLEQRLPSVAPRHVKRAIDYIRAHPHQVTSPETLAAISGVSVRSLQYSFKAFTQQTISEYQLVARLSGAQADLLSHPENSISAIASKWGFSSPSSFSKAFGQSFGMTPSQMRRARVKT
ncbi:AraC family transcriptional regulator [Rhizobium lemnae]|uniref:Helix-turn-helix domain-containing protein n=1 Tax=Rhizobium lemnae TaxID=1214924 RepID=A0ABV8ED19_9HYPH|nr:AraC family transcriptional regulator [Rhizobium lemnae]MCJ8507094.1 AraC family transcriptional regulator [Rhizobium lemnae]